MQRCEHGVYAGTDGLAWGCQICHPPGWQDEGAPVPVLPRSSSDPLNADRTNKLETCTCGNIRTYFTNNCRVCGLPFPETDERGRQQATANSHQSGSCPNCGSTVHFETKKKTKWLCADCDTQYPAVKRKSKESAHA